MLNGLPHTNKTEYKIYGVFILLSSFFTFMYFLRLIGSG